jgi:CheY-like chemotaxis protein/two-component sensor histidine kinase
VLGVIIDVSETRRHERLKVEFVATVSHELRTPLTSISGSLGLLIGNAGGQLPESMVRLLQIAHKNSQRLVRLINDVLDIEKIESGKMDFDLKRVEARALVEQAIEAARGFSDGYGVEVRLGPESQRADVHADPDRLTQVITNLLSNAIKFSPPGGEVVVTLEHQDKTVRIAVRDHGPGIPPAFRNRIFEKFAQADVSDTRAKGGTGLGLSIAKQIVLRLGGEIGFADAPGGGTVFFVTLPVIGAGVGASINGELKNGFAGAGPRLLICDDDSAGATAFSHRLEGDGFTTDIAPTGREAIERAASTPYAAILLDLKLPDCDGISLIQQLRSQTQTHDTPILVMSGHVNGDHRDTRAFGLDVLDWFQKPVNINRLAQMLVRISACDVPARPRVLHADKDPADLQIVSQTLAPLADVVSVDSVEAARHALNSGHFDLAVVDIALISESNRDLLRDLHDSDGAPIPVIVFSPQGANAACAERAHASLSDSPASLDGFVAMLQKRLQGKNPRPKEH